MRQGLFRQVGRSLAWLFVALAVVAGIAAFALTRPPRVPSDTIVLVRGTETLNLCLDANVWIDCERYAIPRGHRVEPYPPYQRILALPLLRAGASESTVFRALQVLNLLALVGLVVLMGVIGRRTGRRWAAPLLALVAVAGPLAWYGWTTFGEALAIFLIAACAAAALLRAPPLLLGPLVVLAGLTKETAAPFVLVLAALALVATPLARRPLRKSDWIALGIGTAVAFAAHAGLNEWRWGQLTNVTYTNPVFHVQGFGLKARLFLSLWAAPNGGTALWWPSVTLVLAGLVAAVVARPRRALPALVLLALLAAQTALLASWYSPFGWVGWGPRLMLPFLPAIALVAVVLHLDLYEGAVRRIGSSRVLRAVVAAILVVALIPQAGVLIEPAVVDKLFVPDPANARCPAGGHLRIDPGGFYRCEIDVAWRRPSVLADAASGATHGVGPLLALLFAGAATALVFEATRRSAVAQPDHEP